MHIFTGIAILISCFFQLLRHFIHQLVLLVKQQYFLVGFTNIEYEGNRYWHCNLLLFKLIIMLCKQRQAYNPVATVFSPLCLIRLSLTFSLRYAASGSKAPPARSLASATSARTSVRKAVCNTSCAATTSFCCCA